MPSDHTTPVAEDKNLTLPLAILRYVTRGRSIVTTTER